MPQQIPAIGADVSSLMPQVGADVSHLMDTTTPRKPAATEDYLPPPMSWLDSAKNFVTNFAHNVDPRPALKLVYDAAQASPLSTSGDHGAAFMDDVKGLTKAQIDQFKKGYQAYREGRYSEAAGHTVAGALPLVGPAAANAGEQIGSGDVSGGLGSAAALLAPVAVGELAPRAIPSSVKVGGKFAPKTAQLAEAVKFGSDHGIPLDAATATGSELVKSIQKKVSDSMGGAGTAERFKAAQAERLATVGEQLAAKANPGGGTVTAEQAGAAAQSGVRGSVHEWNAEASKAYEKLRTIEADPANLKTIEPDVAAPNPDAPAFFSMKAKPKVEDVFLSALEDARKNGYKGTAGELKATFDDRVESARSLKSATAEGDEYSHAALLKEIRDRGGIRPYDKDYTAGAPTQKMRGDFQASQQANAKNYGKNAIYRNDGLAIDDMLQQLSEDPKWGAVITRDTDLVDLLHDESMKAGGDSPDHLQHYLQGVGVKPGVQWWKENAPTQHVPMAVDLRPTKAALGEVYNGLKRESELVPVVGDKARALVSLDRLMNGPDHAPLSVVDAALGELKTFARSDNPDLRTIGQGKAIGAINRLHAAVQQAAEAAGPEAVQALTEGRQATTAKYIAADVLKSVEGSNGEPVGAFRRLTARGDSAVQQLRAVATQAPEAIPQIGRAVLDGLLDTATENGGFEKARTIRTAWNKIGQETKLLLYKDPAYLRDVDNFLRLADKISENPNPSGTARLNSLWNVASATAGYPIAKLLYSKAGVRLLTEGYRLPMQSAVAVSKYTARLTAALKAQAALSPAMADGSQEQTPTTIGRR